LNRDDKIIGGMFGLPETVVPAVSGKPTDWMFLKDSNLFLANARSGIMILIDLLEPDNVWGAAVRHLAFHLRYALTNKVSWTIVEVTVVLSLIHI